MIEHVMDMPCFKMQELSFLGFYLCSEGQCPESESMFVQDWSLGLFPPGQQTRLCFWVNQVSKVVCCGQKVFFVVGGRVGNLKMPLH